jgi:hypothetical protein
MPTRYITQGGFVIATIGLLMFGPSKLLGLPQGNLPLTITGMMFTGVTAATVFAPLLVEIILAIEEKEGVQNCP